MANFPGGDYVRGPFKGITSCVVQLTKGDPKGDYKVPAPKGCWSRAVETVTITACDGAGAALKVGDEDDDDGYLQAGDTAVATAATDGTPAVKRAAASARPYANGKSYHAADKNVIFDWDPGTGATTGKVRGVVDLVYPEHWGIKA